LLDLAAISSREQSKPAFEGSIEGGFGLIANIYGESLRSELVRLWTEYNYSRDNTTKVMANTWQSSLHEVEVLQADPILLTNPEAL
jgi:hypothetical protein